ncbi:peptide ABC transporter substrate-binding protein [Streptococcus ilei]|jgi:oligopeptide ABC superfamily ATP binding cassette transporter, binding protein|uniref:peptide ABC transporter substrate-binding protein n=1 Tax=Streptococcus TaxID=1301 RepID=UPI0003B932B9|nr:peptide ABC transporter substrate-binding protein [Streptococcus ilei]AGY40906.1 peptide-binding protein [Streptococcus ilei]
MKVNKRFVLAGVSLASALLLTACGGGSSNQSTYSYIYSTDPNTLDYIASTRTTTSDITSNLVDGLLENDKYGNLIPSLAEDWTVSEDGLVYTYKLRKDAKWYTSEGEEYGAVTAQDFVTGIKHAVEAKSEGLFLIQNSIKGLDAFVKGETKDFNTVGVKALDDYTVQYTLERPESFWNSKTTSGVLFPVNKAFLESQGKDFGSLKPSSILYNGPYYLKNLTSKSQIELVKNKEYYDEKNVHIDHVKLTYNDGSDPESVIKKFENGQYSFATVMPNSSTYKSVKKKFGDNIVYGVQYGTSYYLGFNIDRQKYNHTAKTTDAQKSSTKQAILNKDFRQAVNFAFDREAYAAQTSGADAATKILRNTLVPPTFVQVNGEEFGKVVEKQLVTYGDEWKDVNLDDAQTTLYNQEKAKTEFAKAKEQLQKEGVEFPIHLDYVVSQTDNSQVQQASSFKQSVEAVLGADNVVVDIQKLSDDDFNNITYFTDTAAEKDYDLAGGGWVPDYQDPSTYLESLSPVNGSVFYYLGVDAGSNSPAIPAVDFGKYAELLKDANAEVNDQAVRYEKYAAAQAWLTDSSLILPTVSNGGTPMLQRTVPYSRAASWVGTKGTGTNYKYLELSEEVIKTKDYDASKEKWLKEKTESNKKAQEELKNHIESK